MTFTNKEKEMINKLKKLPKVDDRTDKDELFLRVSSKLSHDTKLKESKRLTLIPILGSLIVIGLLIILLPSIINNNLFWSQNNGINHEIFEADLESASESYDAEDSHSVTNSGEKSTFHQDPFQSYVVQSNKSDFKIIPTAFADNQLQHVVPISLIIPSNHEANDYYKDLSSYVKKDEWGASEYPLKNISFQVNGSEVNMEVPDDFSIEGGSFANVFNKILAMTFRPIQANKVLLKSNQTMDFGPIGLFEEEFPLEKIAQANYKLYSHPAARQDFLVPIPTKDSMRIEEALNDLKNGDELFNVYPTMPSDLNFSIQTSHDELIFTFTDEANVVNDHSIQTMIESILMTAKNYQFDSVLFKNISIDHIGPYKLFKSISVPDAVNPIWIE